MTVMRPSAIALHVEAARRLLRELEQQAATAMASLGRDENEEFFAAIDDRTRTLERLDGVVEAIVQERALAAAVHGARAEPDPATNELLAEVARAASDALEAHQQLTVEAGREQARLAQAHARTGRPDTVARRYAATSSQGARQRTLSVSG